MDNAFITALDHAEAEYEHAVIKLTSVELSQLNLDEERRKIDGIIARIKIECATTEKNDTLRKQVADLRILEHAEVNAFLDKEDDIKRRRLVAEEALKISRERMLNARAKLEASR